MMNRRLAARVWIPACVALAAVGCSEHLPPRPPTTADDVLDYVRNGHSGAKVRMLEPGAQAYVDSVFGAYRKWEAEKAPLSDVQAAAANVPSLPSGTMTREGELGKAVAAILLPDDETTEPTPSLNQLGKEVARLRDKRLSVVAEKQQIRSEGFAKPNHWERYRTLEVLAHYYDALISEAEKRERELRIKLQPVSDQTRAGSVPPKP